MSRKSNPRTSKSVAKKASKLLRTSKSPTVKSVAGAALGGRRPVRKGKK
jgi:hypothetical protein